MRLGSVVRPLAMIAVCCCAPGLLGQLPEYDKIELADGDVLEGLLCRSGETEYEFAEFVRPPGKPMYVVVRPVARGDVRSAVWLEPERRRLLETRLDRFRSRARIDAQRMESLELTECRVGGAAGWRYRGDWFDFESTLNERAARLCAVRVEQIFRAYRHLLPPRHPPASRLTVVVTGAVDEFQSLLAAHSVTTNSPALYLPEENLVLVRTDLAPLAADLERVEQRHQQLLRQDRKWTAGFAARFGALASELRRLGRSADQIASEKRALEAAMTRESRALESRVGESRRRNQAKFASRVHRSFQLLYHEAFHAYWANHVAASDDLPRWLNEGLAQLFESAQLDDGQLRIDAPDAERRDKLRADLVENEPLPLEVVLRAGPRDFHTSQDSRLAARLYRHSWGLTRWLVFEHHLLDRPEWWKLLQLPPEQLWPALTGMSLEGLERKWRLEMTAES